MITYNNLNCSYNQEVNKQMDQIFTQLKIKVKENLNIIKNSNHFLFVKAAVKDKIRLSNVLTEINSI